MYSPAAGAQMLLQAEVYRPSLHFTAQLAHLATASILMQVQY